MPRAFTNILAIHCVNVIRIDPDTRLNCDVVPEFDRLEPEVRWKNCPLPVPHASQATHC